MSIGSQNPPRFETFLDAFPFGGAAFNAPGPHNREDAPVENWFSKVQRHVIARGVFESVADLRRKLMRYIKAYNKTATPLRWTYSNPTKRIVA